MINRLKRISDSQSDKLYIFGAGKEAVDITRTFALLGIRIDGYFDNAQPNGGEKNGLSLLPIRELDVVDRNHSFFYIASYYQNEIKNQLLEKKITNIIYKNRLAVNCYDSYQKLVFPKCDKPIVSVLCTTCNAWFYLYDCMKSLLDNDNKCKFEVIIGDDYSIDLTRDADEYFENVTVIHHKKQKQYLGNANEIAKYAKGKYILLLADDTRFVKKHYIDDLLEYIEQDEKVGAITGKVWCPAENRYTLPKNYEFTQNEKNGEIADGDKICNVENAWPVALLIRKALWEDIGGFEEIYLPIYFEDVDLELKIINSGYDVVHFPKTEINHYWGGYYLNGHPCYERNSEIFNNKWRSYFENRELREYYLNRR